MDLIVMILAAMSGALIGSSTGIFLMYRKLRPVNAVELDALRSKVRTTEFDLNSAVANSAKLKKELAEQSSKVSEEVVEKQKQLDAALAAKQMEAAHRNAAEQRIAELIAEVDAGKARQAELEANAEEAAAAVPAPVGQEQQEQQEQLAAFQAQVETSGHKIQELTEHMAQIAANAAAAQQHSEEAEKARAGLAAELQQQGEDAAAVRAALQAELAQHAEEAGLARQTLEADLTSERERLHVLTEQISELQTELSAQETRLREERVRMQEERESAAKGMELLVMAQQNLSRAIQAAVPEALLANGGNGHAATPEIAPTNGHGHIAPATELPAVTTELQTAAAAH